MNKETIEIPLRKATYEELQEVICELQVERYIKDKEIDRLNNIISELEKWLNEEWHKPLATIYVSDVVKKLKELKDNK